MSLMAAMMLAAAAPRSPYQGEVLRVQDVIARHAELDGKRIKVIGFIPYCRPFSCHITPATFGKQPSLSIGESEDFDALVADKHRRRLIIEATLDARFVRDPTEPPGRHVHYGATDRAPTLRAPKLIDPPPSLHLAQ